MKGKIYFSDFFELDTNVLEKYGAFNISLINDLRLFIDPFLLFNSKKPEYKELHEQIIKYVQFLRDKSLEGAMTDGLLRAWFMFPEIKQNWFGYSKAGNEGRGLSWEFARSLNRNLNTIFANFGSEKIAKGSHLEKLCLIKDGVGRDNISDFCTNLIKRFLLEYTERFATEHLRPEQRRKIQVAKVSFNYKTEVWEPSAFDLPYIFQDYVLLTPKDILTKEEIWINKNDLFNDYDLIVQSISNEQLRSQVSNYFLSRLPKEPSKQDRSTAVGRVLTQFPEILDYYIAHKEQHGDEALKTSKSRVSEVERRFVEQIHQLEELLAEHTSFYNTGTGDTQDEARRRISFLKDVIENKGGHRLFYVDGEPFRREEDLQIAFRLTWFASPSAVDREVNDGRGPVDFSISRGGADKSLVEFKLASNSQLKPNIQKQAEIYEKASDSTHPTIKVIMYFTKEELDRVRTILKELKLSDNPRIVLIDARKDNKPSGSKAR